MNAKLGFFLFVIIFGLLVHLTCTVGIERGLCIRKGKLYNLIFTFGVLLLGISI